MYGSVRERIVEYVYVEGELAEPFESWRGLRQGDGLSCALFDIGLKGVSEERASTRVTRFLTSQSNCFPMPMTLIPLRETLILISDQVLLRNTVQNADKTGCSVRPRMMDVVEEG